MALFVVCGGRRGDVRMDISANRGYLQAFLILRRFDS